MKRTLVILIALFALYFAGLGSYPVVDPDEPRYAQVGKEMAEGGGWLTPHYAGKPWFDKPPLFYWLSGVSELALGPTELAARLPSAMLAVVLVLLVYALASHDFGRRAGFLSAAVMATCIQQIVLARAAVTDMTLAVCLTFALYAYRRWLDAEGRSRFAWAALCGAMTGLGMLAKGPVAPVLLGTCFVIHAAWTHRLLRLRTLDAVLGHLREQSLLRHLTHRLARLRTLDALLGVVAFLAVGLPWYIAMYALHRDAFVQGFIVANNITRFLKPEHAEQTGAWYSYFVNLPIMLAMFFPWSIFLPQALARGWRANDGARLAFVWFAVVFVFFSLSKTILVTYVFPAYPAAAVLVGSLWAASNTEGAARDILRCGLRIGLVLSLLLACFMAVSAHLRYPEAQIAVSGLGALLAAGIAAALVLTSRRSRWDASVGVWAIGGAMAAFALCLVYGVAPFVAPRVSAKYLIRELPRVAGARYATLGADRPSILFYLGRAPIRAGNPQQAGELLAGSDPVFVICDKPNLGLLDAPASAVCAQSGSLWVVTNVGKTALRGAEPR